LAERILLIEDDPRLAGMVSEYLGKAGFHVTRAGNGSQGLALHGREPFDALVLDLMLPDIDGLEICRRVRARAGRRKGAAKADILRFGRLEIDRGARQIRLEGAPRALTSYQFALLLALAERAGLVMSRDALMDVLKGEPLDAFDRSIDVHISRIRAAIEDDPRKPRRIITVRNAGYVFAKAQD
jgi:two-component system phosphate regulon response regulator OmpR